MSARDVFGLYVLVGLGCAIAVWRRTPHGARGLRALSSALATLVLWPLWAPFALAPSPLQVQVGRRGFGVEKAAVVERVDRALADAVAAAAETPMSDLFSARTAGRIKSEVARVAGRFADLGALTEMRGFDPGLSEQRLVALEGSGASDRVIATARLQHESLSRLTELRAADARALDELADLLEALRTQLVLARYEESPANDASAIVSEVWARLEGLGAVLDPGGPLGSGRGR